MFDTRFNFPRLGPWCRRTLNFQSWTLWPIRSRTFFSVGLLIKIAILYQAEIWNLWRLNRSFKNIFYITSSDVSKFVRISLIKSFTIVVASMHQEFFLNAPFVFLCKIFIFCNVFACDETRFHIQRLEAPYLVQIHLVHVFLIGLDLAEVHRQII